VHNIENILVLKGTCTHKYQVTTLYRKRVCRSRSSAELLTKKKC